MSEQTKIRKFNISNLTYEDLENMFFHYTWNSNYNSINENGLHASVGPNSRGIDKKQSIFFSKGLEAVLQTWNVWLKWRLNRLNNPLWKGKTFEENLKMQERFHDGLFTSEEYKKYAEWKNEYLSGSYKNDREKLKELYEYQFAELCNSIYFSFNLEEGIDYKTNQIDYKKLNCL